MERKLNIFNLNLKILNLSAWLLFLISFIAPFRISENGAKLFGYPFAYMKLYEWNRSRFPIMSLSFDLIWFVVDILLIYFIISRIQNYMTKNHK